jgi:hypothetical protein
MKHMKTRAWAFGCLLLAHGFACGANNQVVLAVPARHDLVNLAFDFLAMFPRQMNLVCYAGAGDTLTLERFDSVAGRWVKLAPETWTTAAAERLVLVGEGETVRHLLAGAPWAVQSTVVNGRRLHEVANAVNSYLRMSPAQWRRLADTYQFTLLDRKAEERRYGRYGPPGGRRIRQRVVLDPPSEAIPLPATGARTLVPETAVDASGRDKQVLPGAASVPALTVPREESAVQSTRPSEPVAQRAADPSAVPAAAESASAEDQASVVSETPRPEDK